MDTINEKWNEVLLKIKLEMMPTSYDTWIKPLVLKSVSIEKGIIQLITYSEMSKSILTNRYLNIIETAVAEIYGKKLTVELLISDEVIRSTNDKEDLEKEREYYETVMKRPGNDELQLNHFFGKYLGHWRCNFPHPVGASGFRAGDCGG